MNCFICGESFNNGASNHNVKDHRMWFDSHYHDKFAFASLELFDNIYGKYNTWNAYFIYVLKTNELSAIIHDNISKNTKQFIIDQLYWKNFKELKNYLNKLMVFE